MPLYTFYPCKADGTSDSFVTMELADDAEARVRARRVLAEHRSAEVVVAWQGERKAFAVAQGGVGDPGGMRRAPARRRAPSTTP